MIVETPVPYEIERKFLVASEPKGLAEVPHDRLLQGYLTSIADGPEVRLRHTGGDYYLTVKSAGSLCRSETEIRLSAPQFAALWPATEGRRIEKLRYQIEHGALTIEVDVYQGALTGLITAEVEFKSEDDSRQFAAPEWLGQEVTDDLRYKNKNLALQGRPCIHR
jgi:CYTH domain-containing protein